MSQAIAIWAAPAQVAVLSEVVASLGVRVVSAGSPVRAQGSTLAYALGAELKGDLRDLLADDRAGCAVLAALDEDLGRDPRLPQAVAQAAADGRRVASLVPFPMPGLGAASEWMDPVGGRVPAHALRFGPLLRHAAAVRDAEEVLAAFGPLRSAMVTSYRDQAVPGTGAQLVDALDLLVALLGEPERVDAAHLPAGRPSRGGRTEPLADIAGDLTAHFRFLGGRSAVVMLSDQAGAWSRRATVLGPAGRLDLGDDGHRWVDQQGNLVDGAERRTATPAASSAVGAIAEFLRPIVAGRSTPPLDSAGLGPIIAATLLSARTGQIESPATMRAMA